MLKYVGYTFVNNASYGGNHVFRDIRASSLVQDTSTGVCADFKNLWITQGLDMTFGIDPAVGTVRCSGYMSSYSDSINPLYLGDLTIGFQPTDGNSSIKSTYTDQQKHDQLWNVANTVANSIQQEGPIINVNNVSGYTYKSLGS